MSKIELLIKEIEEAKPFVDLDKSKYLEDFKLRLADILIKLKNNELPESEGRIIGTMRCISEYDSLAEIKSLYDAAADVDLYYSKECSNW